MKNFILLFIILSSTTALAQRQLISRSSLIESKNSDSEKEPTGFYLKADYAKSFYSLDVINEFADQLRVKSEDVDEYSLRLGYSFTENFYAQLEYTLAQVDFADTEVYTLEEQKLDYDDARFVLGYNWPNIGARLGYGVYNYHTFLETDTDLYFHDELQSFYFILGVDYKFPTAFYFDVEMYADLQYYTQSQVGDYSIENGFVRVWGAQMSFGGNSFRFGPGYQHIHRNIKMRHDFFSLQNEMNNKMRAARFYFFAKYLF